jgi:hypothetical protein
MTLGKNPVTSFHIWQDSKSIKKEKNYANRNCHHG